MEENKKYIIYEGYFGHPDKILEEGKGPSWLKRAVELSGIGKSYYQRCIQEEDGTHIDFGSYTIFVKLEQ